MRVFNRQVSGRSLTVFGFETILISGSVMLAAQVHGVLGHAGDTFWRVVLVTVLCELCFYYNDLYDLTVVHSSRELVVRLLQAAGAATIVLAAACLAFPTLLVDPSSFVTALGVFVVAVLTWRLAFNRLAHASHLEERILIVGTGLTARTLAQQIGRQQDFAYRLIGFVEELDETSMIRQHDVLGSAEDIDRIVETRHVDRIVVGLSDRRGRLPTEQLLRAKMSGVRVEDAATTYERLSGKILVDHLKPSWLIFSDGFRVSLWTRLAKRAFDLVCALVGFVLTLPLMVLTALAIRLESRGPVFYCQERVGENGRSFTLFKFRSMRTDAEHGTPIWAKSKDDRVTRVGRVIRLTRLDELPQFWNVLRGDMSFVGPRPERPFFVKQLEAVIPFYAARHVVKPGITGWAQVKYRYGASVEDALEKLRYDLYYIKHRSIAFDVTILLDTVKVIVVRKGAL
jgi:sugar transferase (PEP-CTERM system associated)